MNGTLFQNVFAGVLSSALLLVAATPASAQNLYKQRYFSAANKVIALESASKKVLSSRAHGGNQLNAAIAREIRNQRNRTQWVTNQMTKSFHHPTSETGRLVLEPTSEAGKLVLAGQPAETTVMTPGGSIVETYVMAPGSTANQMPAPNRYQRLTFAENQIQPTRRFSGRFNSPRSEEGKLKLKNSDHQGEPEETILYQFSPVGQETIILTPGSSR